MLSIFADQSRGRGGIAWSRPMRTAVHITLPETQINFVDLTPYLTYGYTGEFVRHSFYRGSFDVASSRNNVLGFGFIFCLFGTGRIRLSVSNDDTMYSNSFKRIMLWGLRNMTKIWVYYIMAMRST